MRKYGRISMGLLTTRFTFHLPVVLEKNKKCAFLS